METKRKLPFRILSILFILCVSVVFTCAFLYNLSPLRIAVDSTAKAHDPSCFYVVGSGVARGMVPYRDFFDNKGPVTYLVYALGHLFGASMWGFVALQIMGIFLSFLMIRGTAQRLHVKRPSLAGFFYLFLYAAFDCGGGYTESIGNVFIIAAFFALADFVAFYEETKRVRFLQGFVIGAAFCLAFLTRFNNAAAVAGVVLGLLIKLLADKSFKTLFKAVGAFIAGAAAVTVPIAVWLLAAGCLKDYVYQTVLINFGYAGAAKQSMLHILFYTDYGYKLLALAAVGAGGILFSLYGKKKTDAAATFAFVTFVSLAVSTLSCLSASNYFTHYLLVALVPSVMGGMLALTSDLKFPAPGRFFPGVRTLAAAALVLTVVFSFSTTEIMIGGAARTAKYAGAVVSRQLFVKTQPIAQAQAFISAVPPQERDDVFSFDVPSNVLVCADVVPSRRLYVSYELFSDINPKIGDELESYFESDAPKWLLLNEKAEDVRFRDLSAVLSSKYTFVDSYTPDSLDTVYLYRLSAEN